jgi:prevent-host-death family protein
MSGMKSVGIRDLKRSISSYLREVQSGEKILITDRRKPLAIISAVENNQESEVISKLAGIGAVTWTGGKPNGATIRVHSRRSVSKAVLEDRE